MNDFMIWWNSSKYCQVVYVGETARQIALDGWMAHERYMKWKAEEAEAEEKRKAAP